MVLQDYNSDPVVGNHVCFAIVYKKSSPSLLNTNRALVYGFTYANGYNMSAPAIYTLENSPTTSRVFKYHTYTWNPPTGAPVQLDLLLRFWIFYQGEPQSNNTGDIPNVFPPPAGLNPTDTTLHADIPPRLPENTILYVRLTYGYNTPNVTTSRIVIVNREGSTSDLACFRDISLVEIMDNITKIPKYVYAKDVKMGDLVNSKKNGFIPVVANMMIHGNDKSWMVIKKDCYGKNCPIDDFYIKGWHPLLINDTEIPACKVLEANKNDEKYGFAYSIATKEREAINVNGLWVYTWKYEDWLEYADMHKILWEKQ